MPRKILALFADYFAQPLFNLRVVDIVVIYPALVAGVVRRIYVPTDFDTKEKAFFGAKAAEKDLKQGLPRSYSDFGSPCFMCLVILLPLGNAAGYQPCGVAILE